MILRVSVILYKDTTFHPVVESGMDFNICVSEKSQS